MFIINQQIDSKMSQYYILTKQINIDDVFENLSVMLPSDTVTVTMVKDYSEIMPAKYIRIHTQLLSDAGLTHMVKQITDVYCKDKNIKILKEVEGRVPLV